MTEPTPQTPDRRLAAPSEDLAEALIAAVRREIGEGLARAYLAGYQAACSDAATGAIRTYVKDGYRYAEEFVSPGLLRVTVTPLAAPCSLCAAAAGEGCASPTCRRPA